LHDATFIISTATVTVSKVIPIVNSIQKIFQTETTVIGISQIYVDIVNSIHRRFKYLEIEPNYYLATFLDPRLRLSVFLNHENLKTTKKLLILKYTNENIHGMTDESQV